jgi:F-type H+-transporting ATPase subunit epsilon
MPNPLRLTVLTPAEKLLDAEGVAWVQARLADGGGIGIYPGHAPLLAEMVSAPLRYADESGEHTLDVEAGVLEIGRDSVTILTGGLAGTSDDSSQARQDKLRAAEEARFDRLAQALLVALRAQTSDAPSQGEAEE